MFTAVPGPPTPGAVSVTVCQFGQPGPPKALSLELTDGAGELLTVTEISDFECLRSSKPPHIYRAQWYTEPQRLSASYNVSVRIAGQAEVQARCSVEMLPPHLPRGGERPFTIWFSSCFFAPHAAPGLPAFIGRVCGDTWTRPHVKVLLGDQVYLDMPIWRALSSVAGLSKRFNRSYQQAWCNPGFSSLLRSGANVFLAGDHEFWNNFPNRHFTGFLRRQRFWDAWEKLALERFEQVQGVSRFHSFDIGPANAPELRCLAVDLSLQREKGLGRLISTEHMDELRTWCEQLRVPGVLALGQPVFDLPGKATDRTLHDYEQFRTQLLPALRACRVDLVILSGDAHLGRVAWTTLNEQHGNRLIELVASPLALVDETAAGCVDNDPQPEFLPGVDGGSATPIFYERAIPGYDGLSWLSKVRRIWGNIVRCSHEHAMTASFSRARDGGVKLRVVTHLVSPDGIEPHNALPYETTLRGFD